MPFAAAPVRTFFFHAGVALLLAASGAAGLLLEPASGFGSPFFPPAGIALALFTSWGTRAGPGVALGLLVLHTLASQAAGVAPGPAVAGALALSAAGVVQAGLGAAWLRRHVDPAIGAGRDVLRFLLLAPLMCALTPSIGLPILAALQVLPGGMHVANWASWWVGDTAGVLVAAPLCWIAIGQPRALWRARRWMLGAPLALACAAGAAAYLQARDWEAGERLQDFRLSAQQAGDQLQARFAEHERILAAMAHALDTSDDLPDAAQFTRAARTYLQARPEISALTWLPHVDQAARAAFEWRVAAELGRPFRIADRDAAGAAVPAAPRADYYPLLYIEPRPQEPPLGLDLAAVPLRGAALRRSERTGAPSATPPVPLLYSGQPGLVLYQAVMREGDPRARAVIGLSLQLEYYLDHALARAGFSTPYAADFADTTDFRHPVRLLGHIDPRYHGPDYVHPLGFGGRSFELRLAPAGPGLLGYGSWETWSVLGADLLLTGLLGGLMLLVTGQHAAVAAQVRAATARVQAREARLEAIVGNAAEAILTVTRAGIIESANAAAARTFGHALGDLPGQPFAALLDGAPAADPAALLAGLADQPPHALELRGRHASGATFPLYLSVARVATPDEALFACILHDLSEQHRTREQLHLLAHRDTLTGLDNRLSLGLHLDQMLAQARRAGQQAGLLFIDLDHFKKVNDSFGHQAGDAFLATAAARLRALVRDSDALARFGGDEFVLATSGAPSAEALAHLAERILVALARPYEVGGEVVHSSASIGVALFPQDGADAAALLRSADSARAAAKQAGRNGFAFFSAALNAAAHERLVLERRLWTALEQAEFELWLQPQVALASGALIGAEALLRWRHPERGLVPPDRFIPLAEETGLILPLGEWVIAEAARHAAGWRAAGLSGLRIAVNLSARQCHGETLLPCLDAVVAAGLDPSCLELEITESAAMQDPERTRALVDGLRARRMHVAIDDFGTGYSSLAYLKLFAINRIKIDRGFVKDIETDPNDAAIVAATVGLAHALGLEVIAEGVETVAQADFLRAQGCDEAQGYLFARPLPPAEFLAFALARRAAGPVRPPARPAPAPSAP
ncbi:MAG: EAL domain-containing protein [Telluria sp.]